MTSSRLRSARAWAAFVVLGAVAVAGFAATPAAHWGAIAARADGYGYGYGYAFSQPSRAVAEQVARAQCERPAGKPGATAPSSAPGTPGATGPCEVRVWFERSCGALATGNFGEWGAATGANQAAAAKAAVVQCDAHLPTEPCRLAASVCSLP